MRPRGTKGQAKGGCAVLLTAVLTVLAACASGQGGDVATVSAPPKLSSAPPKLSDSKIKPASVKRTAVRSKGGKRPAKATEVATDDAHIRALAAKAAPDDPAEQERLVREFKAWSKRDKRQ